MNTNLIAGLRVGALSYIREGFHLYSLSMMLVNHIFITKIKNEGAFKILIEDRTQFPDRESNA